MQSYINTDRDFWFFGQSIIMMVGFFADVVGWLVLEKLRSSTFKSSRVVGGGTGGDRNNIFSNNHIIIMRIFCRIGLDILQFLSL